MKKILPIILVGILVLSGLGASAVSVRNESKNNGNEQTTATHTVLGEYGTATWCHYCVFAHDALKQLWDEGQLDFYYVSLVTDKNSKAYARAVTDYNAYGWPTLWWDGGYRVDVGAGSAAQAKAAYTSSINACGSRVVKDVDIALTATWLEPSGKKMKIDVTVTNNEASTYGGTLRVYITEKTSSYWNDLAGAPYYFSFLDWAFNEPISIDAGDSFSDSVTWDGASHGFSKITIDNIKIIGAVFNDEKHQGYSYPPSGNPFNAYYVDKVVATEPIIVNSPPDKPVITGEKNGKTGTPYQYTFTASDPEQNDVSYYIDWGDGHTTTWTNYQASGTQYTETHTWSTAGTYTIKAKAKDIYGAESEQATLGVTVVKKARDKIAINPLFINLLERFPNAFPALRQLFGL